MSEGAPGTPWPRRAARSAATALLRRGATPLEPQALEAPALVFSPHFDDETLGCGGTILRKRALDAPVGLVFLTDGSASHRDWMDAAELARTRAREGLDAAAALGVEAAQVERLGFPETKLRARADDAIRRVREILAAARPRQVFVPYRHEAPEDHAATFEIVMRALEAEDEAVDVLEYPIWAWVQWPWTRIPPGLRGHGVRTWVRQGRTLRRALRDFRWRVEVADLCERKREALHRHRSQLFRPPDEPDWPVLADVEDGDFLACFFRDFEVFRRTRFPSGPGRRQTDRTSPRYR